MEKIASPFWHPAHADAFLLDWDGVLAQTKLDFSPIYERFFGGKRVMLLEVMPQLAGDVRDELDKALHDLEMSGAETATAVDGAFALVEWLEAQGKPWGVVSRNCEASIRRAAEVIGFPLPDCTMSRDVGIVKPDPAALHLAASRLGVAPSGCVVVGDFLYDLLGARRSCMRAVLVERGEVPWNDLADLAFPRLRDFVADLAEPTPRKPWEYAQLDEAWLQQVWGLCARMEESSPLVGALIERAAALGVGHFALPADALLTQEQWRHWHGLSAAWIGRPLAEACRHVLAERWPLVCVGEGEGDVTLPDNPDAVWSVLRELVA